MLARCNPNLASLRNLDRLFEDFGGIQFTGGAPRVDVREDDGHLYFDAELPGWSKDDVTITVENDILTIRGERAAKTDVEGQNYHIRERRSGSFTRNFQLPTVVDSAKVAAVLKDGILTVTLDKREEVKPRQIEVKVQ